MDISEKNKTFLSAILFVKKNLQK